MCGLAHYLERAGVPTVVIGLIPQHVRRMMPPRALLVPFELGRPIGPPGAPALQRRVLTAALELGATAPADPVIDTFELEPGERLPAAQTQGWACPVSFATAVDDEASTAERLAAEVQALAPWYAQAVRERGRTTAGASGLDFEAIARWLGDLNDVAGADDKAPEAGQDTAPADLPFGLAQTLKLAVEDLKAFYVEAATTQPTSASAPVLDWMWNDTLLARVLRTLAARLSDHPDRQLALYASLTFVPRERMA